MARNTQATETNAYSGWDSVRLAVDSVTSGQLEHFEPSTIANVIDVLSACERRTKLLLGLKKGYWPTVVLWWNKFELEVFADRADAYRFNDQDTEIWYEEHAPGESFKPRFLAELGSFAPQ